MEPDKKSRKKKILLVVLAIVLALIALWFFFLRDFLRDRLEVSPDNLFPFGEPSRQDRGDAPSEDVDDPIGGGIREDEFIPLVRNRLRQITSVPVIGFRALPTDRYYPSQSAIESYNTSRGSVAVNQLEQIHASRVRYAKQRDHEIVDASIWNGTEQQIISDSPIPNPYETFFNPNGGRLITRWYDFGSGFIETFAGSLDQPNTMLRCELPHDGRTFIEGENHPAISGIKTTLRTLYEADVTRDDSFDGTLAQAWNDFLSLERDNLSNENDIPTSTVGSTMSEAVAQILPDDLLRLEERCITYIQENDLSPPYTLRGEFLPVNIDQAAAQPDGLRMVSVRSTDYDTYEIAIYNPLLSDFTIQILSSPFGEWLVQWHNSNEITLQTKPSHLVAGQAYIYSLETGQLARILSDEDGLLVNTSPDGQKVLYSSTNENSLQTETTLLDLTTYQRTKLPYATLADKCAWNASSTAVFCGAPNARLGEGEPDTWFQGRSQYVDTIWVTLSNGTSRRLYDMDQRNAASLDVYKMQVDPFHTDYLYFLDKTTNFLWRLEIDGLYEDSEAEPLTDGEEGDAEEVETSTE